MIDLVQKAYVGEVFGEAMFGALAGLAPEPHRHGYEELERLEATTGAVLGQLAARLGVTVTPDEATVAAGHAKGVDLALLADDVLLGQFATAVDTAMEDFTRMYDAAPADERPAVAQVLGHEVAIRSYVHARMAGASDPSLAVRVHLLCWA